jgi:hypothetical protein
MNIDFGSLLRGAGIFVCVGGILLLVVIALVVRSFASRRNTGSQSAANRPQPWQKPGREQPRYDDDNIQSSGGFGRPAAGRSSRPNDPISSQRRSSNPETSLPGQSSQGDLDDRLRRQRRDQSQDDDNIQSRGGFGGG